MKYVPEWVAEFERCGAWLEAAIVQDSSGRTIHDVFLGICNGEMQFLYNDTAAMVTTVSQDAKGTNIHIYLTGGDLAGAEALLDKLEHAANLIEGPVRISLHGRMGWAKSFLAQRYYKPKTIVMMKDVK